MNKRYQLLAAVLAFAGLAGACSSSEVTRADFIEELTTGDDAFNEATAICAADAMEEAGIDFSVVNDSVDDVDAETQETMVGLLFDCAFENS